MEQGEDGRQTSLCSAIPLADSIEAAACASARARPLKPGYVTASLIRTRTCCRDLGCVMQH